MTNIFAAKNRFRSCSLPLNSFEPVPECRWIGLFDDAHLSGHKSARIQSDKQCFFRVSGLEHASLNGTI